MPIAPDDAAPPPHPYGAITLGRMAEQRWEMQARCGRCRTVLRVDVKALVTLHGADAIWWGRGAACRVYKCRGKVTFWARSVTYGTWVTLSRSVTARELERGRQAELRPVVKPKPVAVDWRRAIEWSDG